MGSVAAFSGNTLPAGWLLCDGSAVSRETYAVLFSVIGVTYGTGDGIDTFNLPNLVDKFVEGSATAGVVKSAGLPNIIGGSKTETLTPGGGNLADNITAADGAFYADGQNTTPWSTSVQSGNSRTYHHILYFNASRSNSIYGNSTTVQPPALTMRYAIYSGVVNKKLWLRTI